ncbi:hypothetical protein MRX96_048096 [Rhipicephalus microplus]
MSARGSLLSHPRNQTPESRDSRSLLRWLPRSVEEIGEHRPDARRIPCLCCAEVLPSSKTYSDRIRADCSASFCGAATNFALRTGIILRLDIVSARLIGHECVALRFVGSVTIDADPFASPRLQQPE